MDLISKVNAIITKIGYETPIQTPIKIAGSTNVYSSDWDWNKMTLVRGSIGSRFGTHYFVKMDGNKLEFEKEKWEKIVQESYSKMVLILTTDRRYNKKKIPVMYYFLKKGKMCFSGKPVNPPYYLIQIKDKKLPQIELKIPGEKWLAWVQNSKKIPTKIATSKKTSDEKFYIYLYRDICYASELAMSESDVLVVLNNSKEQKKDTLQRELERVKAKAETTKGSARLAIPDDVQVMVWNRDQGKCVKCGSSDNLEFDHIIPVSKGGSNMARNIQLLCEKCNRSKGANIGG